MDFQELGGVEWHVDTFLICLLNSWPASRTLTALLIFPADITTPILVELASFCVTADIIDILVVVVAQRSSIRGSRNRGRRGVDAGAFAPIQWK